MHTRNVEYLAICLHLWLAISAITPKDMENVQTCEGIAGSFPWNDDTQNLRRVQYFFKNKYIAESFSPNFSSVKFKGETLKYRLRVLDDDNVAFKIDNVTTADSGEYKISLTYTNGDTTERIGRLDVEETVLGNFNITCNDTDTVVCTCGNNDDSDLYTWVFESLGEETTNESKLDFGHFPKYGSVFCIRRSDCKKSNAFEIPSDSSNQTETVICCRGDTASFPWTDEIPPLHLIEWYFETTQLAQANESSFKRGSLNINKNYTDRFRLHAPSNAGFNLTKVDNDDKGNYQCIITLQSTDIQKDFNWKLRVEGVTGRRGERATSGVSEPFSCGKESDPDDADEQPPASDSSTDATIGIVVTVCIGGIVIAVVVIIVIKRKRNSRTEQGSAGPDGNSSEETGPESHKLVVQEDQTRQPDKQTCERMNPTETC